MNKEPFGRVAAKLPIRIDKPMMLFVVPFLSCVLLIIEIRV